MSNEGEGLIIECDRLIIDNNNFVIEGDNITISTQQTGD